MGVLHKRLRSCFPRRELDDAKPDPPRVLAPIAPGRRSVHGFDVDIAMEERVFGKGMSGEVRLARGNFGFSKCAVKRMQKAGLSEASRKLVETELVLHLSVDHPCIVRLLQVFETDAEAHLVMEALAGGDLFHRVHKEGRLGEEVAADLAKQMLRAISHLHGLCIVHCDVKLENFVFERQKSSKLKLIDFGLAQHCPRGEKLTDVRGTLHYMAPEMFKGAYSEPVDMWSLGVVLYVMLCGKTPWLTSDTESLKMIKAGRPRFCQERFQPLSDSVQQLVKALLTRKPAGRPSPSTALQCQWMLQLARSPPAVESVVLQNLRGTAQAPPLCRAALWIATMCMPLRKSAPRGMREQFSAFGAGNDGIISRDSFRNALARSGVPSAEVQTMFDLIDVNNDGFLTYCDFLAAAAITPADLDDDSVELVFHVLDIEGRQCVTESSLHNFFGASLGQCRAKAMIAEADRNGNGCVSVEEFHNYFRRLRGEDPLQKESATALSLSSLSTKAHQGILSAGKSAALSFASWSTKAMDSMDENESNSVTSSKVVPAKTWT